MSTGNILLSILCLQLLIVIHEWGHFYFARLFGMKVARFSVGFGPKLLGFNRKGTEFVLAAVPLGGYVQIVGMAAEDKVEAGDPDAYPNKPMWQRFVVVLMGPLMNFVLALFCFVFMFGVGFDRVDLSAPKVGAVMPGSAAEEAGMQAGDRLLSIDGHSVKTFEDIPTIVQASEAETLAIAVDRQGQALTLSVRPRVQDGARRLGIEPSTEHVRAEGVGASILLGAEMTFERTAATAQAFAQLFSGRGKGRLVGLPGIVKMLGIQINRGFTALLQLLAVLSINLFLFNLFPIPALDGSRLVFLGIEGVRHKRIDERVENIVHTVGFVLVFGLILFASVRDLL